MVLYSNGFGETNISFQINVDVRTTQPLDSDDTALSAGTIIVIVGSCIVVILLALLITIRLKKRKRKISGVTKIYFVASWQTEIA